jgi:hypothetical protein
VTYRAKSDSQLDAEATAPDASLSWLIRDLRYALWLETPPLNLHQRGASGLGGELDAKGWSVDTDEGGIGVPFSNRFHRWLGTNHRWDHPSPAVRPAMASIIESSEHCHARHTSHGRPGFSRSLCGQLVYEACYLGQEPDDLAWLHSLPLEQVERMLTDALRHARSWRMDLEARYARSPESDPLPERRPIRPAAA